MSITQRDRGVCFHIEGFFSNDRFGFINCYPLPAAGRGECRQHPYPYRDRDCKGHRSGPNHQGDSRRALPQHPHGYYPPQEHHPQIRHQYRP